MKNKTEGTYIYANGLDNVIIINTLRIFVALYNVHLRDGWLKMNIVQLSIYMRTKYEWEIIFATSIPGHFLENVIFYRYPNLILTSTEALWYIRRF